MYYGYFIYQFVLLPKPPFILNILRASERAASHYTPVLYFLSLFNLYYQQTRMIGQPSSFSASSYTPGGGGDGGGVDLALVFRSTWMSYRLDLCFFARNGCDHVLQECRHRTMRSFYFVHKDVEERILCRR